MIHAMTLAVVLFDRFRAPATFVHNDDGSTDEATHITPGQIERLLGNMTPQQRAFYCSPVIRRAHVPWRSGRSAFSRSLAAYRIAMPHVVEVPL